MSTDFAVELSARAHRAIETLHIVVYFAPDAQQEYVDIGLRPGSMPYFASRSAAMGAVTSGVTAATFYNFNPAMVARHIPRAWTLASPEQVLAARLRVADRALTRLLGDELHAPELAELTVLARSATEALTPAGRPLYAAHATLDWPSDVHLQLWHAATLLREYRGDGHLAALLSHGLSGLDALVTHTATGRGFTVDAAKLIRGWSDEQWDAAEQQLRERGLLDAEGALTDAGRELRASVEAATDRMDYAAWRHVGAAGTQRLIELGKRFSRVVVEAGALPSEVFAAPH